MRVVEQIRQQPVERRGGQHEARARFESRRIGCAPGATARYVRAIRSHCWSTSIGSLPSGAVVREHEKLVDDMRHRIDVAHDAVAHFRVVHHFGAQTQSRERRLQVVRDAREHHGAIVLRLRDFAHHLVEAVRQLPQLARAALGHGRRRLAAAEAPDRLRERAQRLLQLPRGEQRGQARRSRK